MRNDEEQAWLNALKAGDDVIVSCGFVHREFYLRSVQRTTPKQIIVEKQRFWRDGGGGVGDDTYHRNFIVQPTPALRARIRRESAIRKLRSVQWMNVDVAVLFAVLRLLEEPRTVDAVDPSAEVLESGPRA